MNWKWVLLVFACFYYEAGAQNASNNSQHLVYVDAKGVLRYAKNNAEAAFFGVNYTTPFAFAYRAHKALNVHLEKAIQQDVYHMARLGFDAFRVHVWDTEISDTAGNLLNNEHLRLFDFLLAELKKRNIKTIITPIAFWGNGYPERDEHTPGFSRKYGKGRATTNDTAIKAQENYLQQFFTHVNPYTKLTYHNDPDVIAVEINNEPSHSGPKAGVTNYINRLNAAIRKTGWTKPVFYNISQNPYYADAVAASDVNGYAMQWYPVGLVANRTIEGNFLPHVDRYSIAFDTIPQYRNKPLMVYEFDAADILKPYMYPAMARSFKSAGFQWATQFAYDPMAIANVNTEYQTHYVNLAYTPSKAISLMIAAEAFHRVPYKKSFGIYPADTLFDAFRVSYKEELSEMNTEEKFYYSNNTNTQPKNIRRLQKIAGVGTSPIVQYRGTGAYFLDKLSDGVWRLEVMPDAVIIREPFERASPKKEVSRVEWHNNKIKILLPDVDASFKVIGLNEGNTVSTNASNNELTVRPGTYLLTRTGVQANMSSTAASKALGAIELKEFVAPLPAAADVYVLHQPSLELSSDKPHVIKANIAGVDSATNISVQVNRLGGGFGQSKTLAMQKQAGSAYTATVPADMMAPGQIAYRIIVQKGDNNFTVFPGNHKESPWAWDNYQYDTWKSFVAAQNGKLQLFNPTVHQEIHTYPVFKRGFQIAYATSEQPAQLVLRLAATDLKGDGVMGFQHFFADLLNGRLSELNEFDRLVIRARTANAQPVTASLSLVTKDATAFGTAIQLTQKFQDIVVPLNTLKQQKFMLLPRPYPGFMPLWFHAPASKAFALADAERLEVAVGSNLKPSEYNQPFSIEVESVWLEKRK